MGFSLNFPDKIRTVVGEDEVERAGAASAVAGVHQQAEVGAAGVGRQARVRRQPVAVERRRRQQVRQVRDPALNTLPLLARRL